MTKQVVNSEELKYDGLPEKIEQIMFIQDNFKEKPYD